jgi:hypothetical protein
MLLMGTSLSCQEGQDVHGQPVLLYWIETPALEVGAGDI